MNPVLLEDKSTIPPPALPPPITKWVLDTSMFSEAIQEDMFFQFCTKHRDFRIEMTENKEIVIMAPTGSETGSNNAELTADIVFWNRKTKKGKAFDSSAGFKMPNGAIRSPDVSWLPIEKWKKLSKKNRKKYAPICPDFVLELRSATDTLPPLLDKMQEYIANGCRLAWLIDVDNEKAYIFRADGSTDTVDSFDKPLSGEDVLEGFEMDLSFLKE